MEATVPSKGAVSVGGGSFSPFVRAAGPTRYYYTDRCFVESIISSMAELLVSTFVDPDTAFDEQIRPYEGVPVQLGFFNPHPFFDLDHERLKRVCDEWGVPVRSVHAPTVDVFDEEAFFEMLGIVRDVYEVDNVTLHPGRDNPIQAFEFFDKKGDRVDEIGVDLMYENFDDNAPNERWLPRAKNIITAPPEQVALTYDTSHVGLRTNVLRELRKANEEDRLGMVHLSDRTNDEKHLPVYEGAHDMESIVEFLKARSVFVCLEYIEREERLIADYHELAEEIE